MGIFRKADKKQDRKGHRQCEKKCCWKSLAGTKFETEYRKKCRLLEEAGIDYRVWMDEDEPSVVFYREYFLDPVLYRRHYNFYVQRADYEKACRVLNIIQDKEQGFAVIYF